ncbi:MAG: hypothetical protein AAB955_03985 [Patescibacteria group bacterium]
MKKVFIGLGIVLLAAGAAYFIFEVEVSGAHYESAAYGISFRYPEGYLLSEAERGNAERFHYAIVMVRADEANPPIGGEGPRAVTIDVYQNNLDNLSLADWLDTGQSNFKLGDGTKSAATVDGVDAIRYRWSGLYEGETTAFLHRGSIIAISATFFENTDEQYWVYEDLLKSIELER